GARARSGAATLPAASGGGGRGARPPRGAVVPCPPPPPAATNCSNGLTCVSVSPDSSPGIFKTVPVAGDGTYLVTGLPDVTYRVQAQGDGFATRYYNAKATQQLADPVAVTGNATT